MGNFIAAVVSALSLTIVICLGIVLIKWLIAKVTAETFIIIMAGFTAFFLAILLKE